MCLRRYDSRFSVAFTEKGAKTSDHWFDFRLPASRGVRPFIYPRPPILSRSARIATDYVNMNMRNTITNYKRVDVFHAFSLEQCLGNPTCVETNSLGFFVGQICQFGNMTSGFHEHVPKIVVFLVTPELCVRDEQQLIFIDDSAGHRDFTPMLAADQA